MKEKVIAIELSTLNPVSETDMDRHILRDALEEEVTSRCDLIITISSRRRPLCSQRVVIDFFSSTKGRVRPFPVWTAQWSGWRQWLPGQRTLRLEKWPGPEEDQDASSWQALEDGSIMWGLCLTGELVLITDSRISDWRKFAPTGIVHVCHGTDPAQPEGTGGHQHNRDILHLHCQVFGYTCRLFPR